MKLLFKLSLAAIGVATVSLIFLSTRYQLARRTDLKNNESSFNEGINRNSQYYSTTGVQKEDLVLSERGLYEYNNKPFIWIYWEGHHRPAYVDLCLETLSCHNFRDFNVKVLNDTEFIKSVKTVHKAYQFLRIHHRSDYFRAKILHTFGGIYLDIDTIGMKSYKELAAKLPDADVVGASSRGNVDNLHVGDLGPMKAGTKLTTEWMARIDLILDLQLKNLRLYSEGKLKEYPVQWSEIVNGAKPILERLVTQKKIKYSMVDGPSTWTQYDANQMMGSDENITSKLKDTEILSLNNALYPQNFKEMGRDEILKSNIGISQLIKYSLEKCKRGFS